MVRSGGNNVDSKQNNDYSEFGGNGTGSLVYAFRKGKG